MSKRSLTTSPSDLEPLTVLLTGFGAFPGVPANISERLVPMLGEAASVRFPDHLFVCDVLPVTWREGPLQSRSLIERHAPGLVLHFGVSDLATGFQVERYGHNTCRMSADAAGLFPISELLDPVVGPRIASEIRVDDIVSRLRALGYPATASEDAGGYLCNAVLFDTLSHLLPGQRAGFVHVPSQLRQGEPRERQQPDTGGLTMEQAVSGGLEIIAACLEE